MPEDIHPQPDCFPKQPQIEYAFGYSVYFRKLFILLRPAILHQCASWPGTRFTMNAAENSLGGMYAAASIFRSSNSFNRLSAADRSSFDLPARA